MEKYIRKIKIKKQLTPLDTNNDGIDDTIAYLNKDNLYVSVLLKQSVKDLGVYTDYQEEEDIETIDLENFWDLSNDGANDGGEINISSFTGSDYGNGLGSDITIIDESDLEIIGCTDPNAVNYSPTATIDCCCDYGFSGGGSSGSGGSGGGTLSGGCYRMSTGYVSTIPTITDMAIAADEWCRGVYASCGSSYPNQVNCTPNGCTPSTTCCPDPTDNLRLLLPSDCTDNDFDCTGQDCGCGSSGVSAIFPVVKYTTIQGPDDENGNPTYNTTWQFYCIPDN